MTAAVVLFAACSESGTDPSVPTAPTFPDIRGYNEVSSGTGWVRAELDDYLPGQTVTILGGGWEPGETIVLRLTEEPDVQQDLIFTSVADENGSFANSEFQVTEIHLNVVFTLTAEGQSSGMTASTMFDDGRTLNSVVLDASAVPITVAPGATISAKVNVTTFVLSGTGNDNWRSTSWRIATADGARTCVDHPDHNGAGTYEETLSITAPLTPGTYSAFFQAHQGDDCGSGQASNVVTLSNFVVVESPPSDVTPPSITYLLTPASPDGDNGWYRSDVTLTWTVTEDESAASLVKTGCVDQSITADQAETTYSCSAESDGGSAGPVEVKIKRDATAPTISGSAAPAANGNGWNNTDVDVSFTCGDALSGVASCGPNQTLTSDGADQSVLGTAKDNAGNTADDTVSDIDIDKTAPVVSVTGVSNGATYTLGAVPAAGCTTTDALSGVATDATLASSGGPVGSITATCSGALDNADNSGSASATYNVIYDWAGFFRPVDNEPTVNTVKAGSAIPVKFSLGGNQGLGIFATGFPKSQKVLCESGVPQDTIEETVTAGGSSLSYDPIADQYVYVWKTEKSYAGTCRQLTVTLIDGTVHTASFNFTR
jgi:hypothetical protein